MLELFFVHWSRKDYEDYIQKMHMTMTGRSTHLGCAGMAIFFVDDFPMALDNYVKSNSYFNHLKFYAFDILYPGHLDKYELFKNNLNFYA